MALFHVSCKLYSIGECLIRTSETQYFKKKKEKNQEWVDLMLNQHKPNNAPLRQYTYYAFDSISNCGAFFSNHTCATEGPFYYSVEMKDPVKVPMCLIDLILHEGQNSNNLTKIISEYWNPTLHWNVFEYLSNEMKIISLVDKPSAIITAKGKIDYGEDVKIRRQLK